MGNPRWDDREGPVEGWVATSPGEPNAGCEYKRRRPEVTVLYDVVRDNVETLHGAIDDGTLDVRLPFHAIKELDAADTRRLTSAD